MYNRFVKAAVAIILSACLFAGCSQKTAKEDFIPMAEDLADQAAAEQEEVAERVIPEADAAAAEPVHIEENESEEEVLSQNTLGSPLSVGAPAVPETTEEEPTEPSHVGEKAVAMVPNYVNVRTGPSTEDEIVGKIYNECAADILDQVEGEDGLWFRISSGNVIGYIKASFFVTGADAEALREEVGVLKGVVMEDYLRVRSEPDLTDPDNVFTYYEKGTEVFIEELTEDGWAKIKSDEASTGYVYAECLDIWTEFKTAITLKEEEEEIARREAAEEAARIAQEELEAALAAQAEAERIAAEAQAAAEEAARQQAAAEEAARIAAEAQAAELARQQAAAQAAAEEAARQAAAEEAARQQQAAQAAAQAAAEEAARQQQAAEEAARQQEDAGTDAKAALRNAVVSYALQFVGNPYVHGGRSLVTGTDCSGFTSLVYQNFGYFLSYTPEGQSSQGVRVDLNDLKPGDLLFYSNSYKYLGHVAMYIGNGQIVHAGTEATGIIIGSAYYRQPLFANRIIN